MTLEKGQASLAQEVTDIKTDIRRLDDKFDRLDTKVTILASKVNEIADDSKVTRQYLDQAFEHISGLKFPRVSRLVRRK